MMRIIQTGCRAHAAEIEAKGWPTALSRDLRRAAERIEWLEGATNEQPAHGEGPTAGETEDYSADAQEAERRKKEMDAQAKAAHLAALMRPEHKVRRLRGA